MRKQVIIGGGAAGCFYAIQAKENFPEDEIIVLEAGGKLLQKVLISGGGRCNVTHACFDPKELIQFYPRGHKELLGPFHQFAPGDMMEWLERRGVATKIEEDNRVFPTTDDSKTIINCFMQAMQEQGVKVRMKQKVSELNHSEKGWKINTGKETFWADKLIIATGSNPQIWKLLSSIGVEVVPSVPSLFTFKIKHPLINGLMGIALPDCEVKIPQLKVEESGPVLITHWGLSGPGILKISAWSALELSRLNYQFKLKVNWIKRSIPEALRELQEYKQEHGKRKVIERPLFNVPKRFWENLCHLIELDHKNWADVKKKQLQEMATLLTDVELNVNGRATNKSEFVTAGGVDLKQINFKTMQLKGFKDLYTVGEVNNIDAVTGGFNFQAAWTTAFICAQN